VNNRKKGFVQLQHPFKFSVEDNGLKVVKTDFFLVAFKIKYYNESYSCVGLWSL